MQRDWNERSCFHFLIFWDFCILCLFFLNEWSLLTSHGGGSVIMWPKYRATVMPTEPSRLAGEEKSPADIHQKRCCMWTLYKTQINRTFQKLNTDKWSTLPQPSAAPCLLKKRRKKNCLRVTVTLSTRLPSGGQIKQIKHISLVLMAFASWLLDAMHMKWLIIYMKSDVRLWSHYGCMPHQRRVCSCSADRQCWGKYVKAWWRTLVFNDFLLHSTTKCNIWYSVCMKSI